MPSQTHLAGEWVGSFRLTTEVPRYLRVEFSPSGDSLSIRALVRSDAPVFASGTAAMDGDFLKADLQGAHPLIRLRGEVRGDVISGVVEHSHGEGTFQLLRMATLDVPLYDEYAGAYEVAPGRTVFVRKGVRLGHQPPYRVERSWLYYVAETGETRVLFPSSERVFYAGPALLIPNPVELTVEFVRDVAGAVAGLLWRESGAAECYAHRSQRYSEHDLSFRRGNLTLAGRLLLPSGRGPHPAIVMIPGGPGPADRDSEGYLVVAHLFALHGIAALVMDKRGCGASEGDWREATFDDLAGDALAAVDHLCARSDIDERRIGLFGVSEGGWIAPLAATRSDRVSCVVLVGASAVSHAQADVQMREHAHLHEAGLAQADIDALAAFDDCVIEFARSGLGWEGVALSIAAAQERSWFPHSLLWKEAHDLPDSPDHWFWRMYGASAFYDPGPTLRDLRIPLLAIWGELDEAAPAAANVSKMEMYLRDRVERDQTLHIIAGGDHTLWQFDGEDPTDFQLVVRFVPEYFDLLTGWLRQRLLPQRP